MTRSDVRLRLIPAALIAAVAVLAVATAPLASVPAPVARAALAATPADMDADDGAAAPAVELAAAFEPVDAPGLIATEGDRAVPTARAGCRPCTPLALAPKTSPPALRS